MCTPMSHFSFLVFIPLGQLLVCRDAVQCHLSRDSRPKTPELRQQKRALSPLSWQRRSSESSHALRQELWSFISAQAHKLACQFHAGRSQENPGWGTMASLVTAPQATQDSRSASLSLLLSPLLRRSQPRRIRSRQWNPEDRESQATDGLRADPSALVPKGSTVFTTLDSRQARAPLRVETPALA